MLYAGVIMLRSVINPFQYLKIEVPKVVWVRKMCTMHYMIAEIHKMFSHLFFFRIWISAFQLGLEESTTKRDLQTSVHYIACACCSTEKSPVLLEWLSYSYITTVKPIQLNMSQNCLFTRLAWKTPMESWQVCARWC